MNLYMCWATASYSSFILSTSSASSYSGCIIPMVLMNHICKVTNHEPGQLTVYPILDCVIIVLTFIFVCALEEAILVAL